MGFSYDESQICTNIVSFVRFQLDDTSSTAYAISNEVITALYNDTNPTDTQISRFYLTALRAAEYLYVKYSKLPASYTSAGTTVNRGDRLTALAELIQNLRLRYLSAAGISPVLYAERSRAYYECFDDMPILYEGYRLIEQRQLP